jgi:hypothetical protein
MCPRPFPCLGPDSKTEICNLQQQNSVFLADYVLISAFRQNVLTRCFVILEKVNISTRLSLDARNGIALRVPLNLPHLVEPKRGVYCVYVHEDCADPK